MRLPAFFLAIAVGLFGGVLQATAAPPAKEPAVQPRFQLVGFTGATFQGDQGVLTYSRACDQEFPGSRMCSSTKVMETLLIPSDLAGFAWVRPVFQPLQSTGFLDPSGILSGQSFVQWLER